MNTVTDLLADPIVKTRAVYPHWAQETVRWSDTDMIGHANNLAFGAFLETGRAMLLQRFMRPDAQPRAMLLLAEMRTKYLGEMHWPAQIAVGTAVAEVGNKTVRVVQALFDGDRCTGTAESVLVLIDEQTRRARVIPDDVREALDAWMLIREPAR